MGKYGTKNYASQAKTLVDVVFLIVSVTTTSRVLSHLLSRTSKPNWKEIQLVNPSRSELS